MSDILFDHRTRSRDYRGYQYPSWEHDRNLPAAKETTQWRTQSARGTFRSGDTGRRVIYYDQLGCGNSHPPSSKPSLWTIDLFVQEVDVVRKALGLDRIHLLGQS